MSKIQIVFLLAVLGWYSDASYPPHWWKVFPKDNVPTWEILPDAVVPPQVILSKRNELGILSNFAATPFKYHGKNYASVEGFWQSLLYPESKDDFRALGNKVKWKFTREQVEQMSGFEAKAAGDLAFENMKRLKINWVSYQGERMPYWTQEKGSHYQLILRVMTRKLKQNPQVKSVLLATGDLTLRPDHIQEPNAPPAWRYYDIWMELRTALRQL